MLQAIWEELPSDLSRLVLSFCDPLKLIKKLKQLRIGSFAGQNIDRDYVVSLTKTIEDLEGSLKEGEKVEELKCAEKIECPLCETACQLITLDCGNVICNGCFLLVLTRRYYSGVSVDCCPVSTLCAQKLTDLDLKNILSERDIAIVTQPKNQEQNDDNRQMNEVVSRCYSICRRTSKISKQIHQSDSKLDRVLSELGKLKNICIQCLAEVQPHFPSMILGVPETYADKNGKSQCWSKVSYVLQHPFVTQMRLLFLCEGTFMNNSPHLTTHEGILVKIPRKIYVKLLPVLKALLVLAGVVCTAASSEIITLDGVGAALKSVEKCIKAVLPKDIGKLVSVGDIEDGDALAGVAGFIASAASMVDNSAKALEVKGSIPEKFNKDAFVKSISAMQEYLKEQNKVDVHELRSGKIFGLQARYCEYREKIVYVCEHHHLGSKPVKDI